MNVICPQYCRIPYCEPVCPTGAIVVGDKTVSVDSDRCNGCGLCKMACLTWSLDKNLAKRSLDRLIGKS